jgi:hypothetical protein
MSVSYASSVVESFGFRHAAHHSHVVAMCLSITQACRHSIGVSIGRLKFACTADLVASVFPRDDAAVCANCWVLDFEWDGVILDWLKVRTAFASTRFLRDRLPGASSHLICAVRVRSAFVFFCSRGTTR